MKKTLISMALFSLASGTAFADNASEQTTMKEQAKAQTMLVVGLAKTAASSQDLASYVRTPEESKIKRHGATPDNVRQWFKDIDVEKIKIGRVDWIPAKDLVIVRMEEPIRCDLEFHIEAQGKTALKLQAIHP
jgi:hypothetical protein